MTLIFLTFGCSIPFVKKTDRNKIEKKEEHCSDLIFTSSNEKEKQPLKDSDIKSSVPEINELISFENLNSEAKQNILNSDVLRYKAMVMILKHAEFALKSQNSSEALNFLLIGKQYFPYHDGIKELYSIALDEFIKSTKALVESNCTLKKHAQKRIDFINKIAPDMLSQLHSQINNCHLEPPLDNKKDLLKLKSFAEKLNLNYCKEEKEIPPRRLDLKLKLFIDKINSFPVEKLLMADLEFLSKMKFKVQELDIDKSSSKTENRYSGIQAEVFVNQLSIQRPDKRQWISSGERIFATYQNILSDQIYDQILPFQIANFIGDERGQPGIQGYGSKYFLKVSAPVYKKISGKSANSSLPVTNISSDGFGNYYFKLTLHFDNNTNKIIRGRLSSKLGTFGTFITLGNHWCSGNEGNGINPTIILNAQNIEQDDVRKMEFHYYCPDRLVLKAQIREELLSQLTQIDFELDLARILETTMKEFEIKL